MLWYYKFLIYSGINKTEQKINKKYFTWFSLTENVKTFVIRYYLCQLINKTKQYLRPKATKTGREGRERKKEKSEKEVEEEETELEKEKQ